MRAYFLVPDAGTAEAIVDALLLKHVEWRHIHVIANSSVPLTDLPEAGLSQKSDLFPALGRGTAMGGGLGAFLGLVAVIILSIGLTVAGGTVLAMSAAGATFGWLLSTMISVNVPSSRLKRFEDEIKHGRLLMMVDVPRERLDDIQQVIREHCPAVEIEGPDLTIPAFP